jgi:hypothetical protein
MVPERIRSVSTAACLALAAATTAMPGGLMAGPDAEVTAMPPAPAMVEDEPFVTGTLSFMGNTHFISYGQDVWGAGSNWDDLLFNPSLELAFNLGDGWSAIVGTWWDVNDNVPDAEIGGYIQEVDVWGGLSYGTGPWSFTLLYQAWMYASQTEQIVDFKVGYDHFLKPSLTLHGRVAGADPFDTGVATVLGIAPGTDVGPVSLSFPVNVAFDTEDFHGGDAGFSFASAGVSLSIPIVEHVSASLGATYYHTDDGVIPGNPDEDFVTGTFGITITF